MFLTNWLMVTRIVAASVIEAVDYPTPEEFFLAFDGTNTLFMYGGSKDTSSTSNVAIYYDGYKHETGNAYPVVLSEPGEYKALVDVCGTRYLTSNVTVGAVSPVLSSGTLAFHHGNFDDVYGDGDVATAAANGHVYADTPTGTYSWGTLTANTTTSTNTTYEWTPLTDLTADVLMVAGGGGGGGVIGGGGGAGGLLYHTNQNLSGTKTIVVGNGGIGGIGFFNAASEVGTNGTNTSFTGFDNAIGGGRGGANYVKNGNNGGSGGGGTYDGTGGSGTSLQGNAGGGGGDDGDNAGGGGGSGGTGGDIDVTNDISGNGGIGTNLISTFGILYGDGGYFASGGGGGARTGGTAGTASQGGGTNGTSSSTAADDAQKHTGGGGGGAGYDVSSNSRLGGDGGSGIVLLSYQYSTDQLSYNNYNKLTVANTSNANVETNLRLGANTWDIATASNIWICKPGDYKSFTVDPDAQTAYFGNVTVGTVTEQLYDPVADLTENSEIDHGTSTSTLKACSISLDGTRVALGADNGRVKVYHLETGVWTLKKEYTKSSSFGTQVCLNDAGTRLFVSDPLITRIRVKFTYTIIPEVRGGIRKRILGCHPMVTLMIILVVSLVKVSIVIPMGTRLLVVTGYTGIKKAWIFDHNGSSWNTLATKTWTSSSTWWGIHMCIK
jgi:hypothetical protein